MVKKFFYTFEVEFQNHKTIPYQVNLISTGCEEYNVLKTKYIGVLPLTHVDLFTTIGAWYSFGGEVFKNAKSIEDLTDRIKDQLGRGIRRLYSPSGEKVEEIVYSKMWPDSINFGDLCYSSDPHIDVEVTWRYLESTKVDTIFEEKLS